MSLAKRVGIMAEAYTLIPTGTIGPLSKTEVSLATLLFFAPTRGDRGDVAHELLNALCPCTGSAKPPPPPCRRACKSLQISIRGYAERESRRRQYGRCRCLFPKSPHLPSAQSSRIGHGIVEIFLVKYQYLSLCGYIRALVSITKRTGSAT